VSAEVDVGSQHGRIARNLAQPRPHTQGTLQVQPDYHYTVARSYASPPAIRVCQSEFLR
jgi:hypothetical protein